ncbi:inorganic phosphate transporter [Micromonospora sp. NPDC049559]|uniref:inorganic phosphate transporter n=1 Tax=Micromonospora sp. NPDC049559 TaxID=3155923 RepID=UPI003420E1E0
MAGVLLFALFAGFNDAGALVGLGLRARPGVLAAMAVLVVAVVLAPLAVGTAVAATLTGRLASFGTQTGRGPLLVGIAAAVAVTAALAARGLPTSLTLALVGGIAGAGTAVRAPVDWAVVGGVLAAGALAPLAGGLVSAAVARLLRAAPAPSDAGRRLRWSHAAAFAAVCLAYGANDGQKLLAVYAAVHGGAPDRYATAPGALALLAGGFALGGLLGLPRAVASMGGGLTALRSDAVVVTELSGAAVVLGTAAAGAPVSMTQSISGALVGTGLFAGTRRVRWRGVLRLGRAWVLTLPAAFAVAAAGCLVPSALR